MEDDHLAIIEEIQDNGTDLTDWELEFLDSLTDQIADDRELTEKQIEKLDDIYNERVS